MRRLGPYNVKAVPSFATLVADSTPDRRVALEPLQTIVAEVCAAYDAASPDVHILQPLKLTKDQKSVLIDGYDNRTAAM